MLVNVRLILDYYQFFGENPPENRIDFIKKIPKDLLIYEFAGLNFKLKYKTDLFPDNSFNTQKELLKYFCMYDMNTYNKYSRVAAHFTRSKSDFPLIFTKSMALFALEEIINTNFPEPAQDFKMAKIENWESVLIYILAVNFELNKVPVNETPTLENITASSILHNEPNIDVNPIFTLYRGFKLINYFINETDFKDELIEFFNDLNTTPYAFLGSIMHIVSVKGASNKYLQFAHHLPKKVEALETILRFTPIHNSDYKTLLSLKKNPVKLYGESKYVVLDYSFLINKSYMLLLNDFWFDKIKGIKNQDGSNKYNINVYRGTFGYFFESYVKELLLKSFHFLKHPKPFLFNDLKFTTKQGDIEIADIYIRQKKKVIIGQVKSISIYDKEKFSGDISEMYRNDREKFFSDFGLGQLIDSINYLNTHSDLFDSKISTLAKLTIYPVLIVNEDLFKTPLFTNIFKIRFEEIIEQVKNDRFDIKGFVVLHVSDIEHLLMKINNKNLSIWELLNDYLKRTRKEPVLPPFSYFSREHIDKGAMPDFIFEEFKDVIDEYNKILEELPNEKDE
jgi:hypothetical protein